MVTSWQQIWTGKITGSSARSIDTGADAFGEYPFLRIIIDVIPDGAPNVGLRFNGDETADQYPIRRSLDGAADNTSLTGYTYWYNGYGGTDVQRHLIIDIANEEDKEKLIYSNQVVHSATFTSPPQRQQVWSKWRNTVDYITDIELDSDSFDATASNWFDVGSKMTIFGGSDGTAVNPNLPNGSIFITSDTNVHYMWNSSANTWHEVA
tara:strand:- start:1293 stop:1916 length:624 start_codon:yes stop_codon:yes gene_type:complete